MFKLFIFILLVLNFIGVNCQAATDKENPTSNLYVSLFENYLGIGLNESTELCLTALKYLADKSNENWAINGWSQFLFNSFFV